MAVILIVEDEPALLDLYSMAITEMGHEVRLAHDGDEALKLAKHETPHVVLSDFMMPRRTGIELMQALRADARLAHVPFILASAAKPPEAAEAWRFLTKPVSLPTLEESIRAALAATASDTQTHVVADPAPEGLVREHVLSWIAHELRTPMSTALLAAQMLARDYSHDTRPPRIVAQLLHADRLMTSILDAARIEDGKLALKLDQLNLVRVVEEVVSRWRGTAPAVPIEVDAPNEPLFVRGDEACIQQILDNLISNALKYGSSPRGIRIDIRNAGAIRASIQDFGPGISATHVANIFDRFYRVPGSDGRGHGLGLYIAAALTRALGGQITVESREGHGATFHVTFPPWTESA
jgi:two-component system, sensor histidine kinase and response regulator